MFYINISTKISILVFFFPSSKMTKHEKNKLKTKKLSGNYTFMDLRRNLGMKSSE